MPNLYLIAHKVRGEPAFDIAERCEIAGEEAWIIPTSGHRAYPFAWFTFEQIGVVLLPDGCWAIGWDKETGTVDHLIGIMPEGLRDHYEAHRESPQPGSTSKGPRKKVVDIDLSDLGL